MGGGSEDETEDDNMIARSVDKAVKVVAKKDHLARESQEIEELSTEEEAVVGFVAGSAAGRMYDY